MIGRCSKCGGQIAARRRRASDEGQATEYTCHAASCVRLPKAEVDLVAERAIKGYVKRPDVYERFAQRAGNGGALRAVRDEIADIRAEHRELADQVGRGEVSALLAARAEPAILARLKAAEKRETELMTPTELAGIFEPGQDVDTWWEDAPMSVRRAVAAFLLRPEWLGYLVVLPSPIRGHRSEPGARVEFRTEWDPAEAAAARERERSQS